MKRLNYIQNKQNHITISQSYHIHCKT